MITSNQIVSLTIHRNSPFGKPVYFARFIKNISFIRSLCICSSSNRLFGIKQWVYMLELTSLTLFGMILWVFQKINNIHIANTHFY